MLEHSTAAVSIIAIDLGYRLEIPFTYGGIQAVQTRPERRDMRKPFLFGVGGVVSADIAVPDRERELAFYSAILTTGDAPLWRDDLTNNLGTPVIGLGARTPEYDALPLQWMPHFQVADVAASASSALAMGGKELIHGKTDEGQSQWAGLTDPSGAAFGIIPAVPGESGNAQPSGRLGCISWLSITVPDASSIRDFYQQVVGWSAKSLETEQSKEHVDRFEMRIDEETSAAEIRQASIEDNDIPPIWLIHLPVGDISKSLLRVQECGGQVIKESAEEGYVVVRDPVGVYFALATD